MFSHDDAAAILGVPREWVRSQTTKRGGLCYDKTRPRGSGILPDELLALAVLRYVQKITGKQSPAAQAIVRQYRGFLSGVLMTPGRTIPDVWVPIGDGGIVVQLRLPTLPEWLRKRVALFRSGQSLPPVDDVGLDVEGVYTAGASAR